MSDKKRNILLILVIVLALFLLGLTCYKFIIYGKKDNKIPDNTIDNKVNDEIYNNIEEKINYEVKEEVCDTENNRKCNVLYINDKKVEESVNAEGSVGTFEYQNMIIVASIGPGLESAIYVVNNKNEVKSFIDSKTNKLKFVELPSGLDNKYNGTKLSDVYTAELSDDKLIVNANRQWESEYDNWYCYLPKDEIASYKVEYEYSNNKFTGKIIEKNTIEEKYKEEDCSSVKEEDMAKIG